MASSPAGDGLLEREVRHEHVDVRQQLLGAIVHVLVEQHAGEADRAFGLRGRVAFDEVETGNSMISCVATTSATASSRIL